MKNKLKITAALSICLIFLLVSCDVSKKEYDYFPHSTIKGNKFIHSGDSTNFSIKFAASDSLLFVSSKNIVICPLCKNTKIKYIHITNCSFSDKESFRILEEILDKDSSETFIYILGNIVN